MKCLRKSDIETIEIELTGFCNLKCPLCLSQINWYHKVIKPTFRPLKKIKEQLDEYTNLKCISLAGYGSEPTLYPSFQGLLRYLKKERDLRVELYTNGSTFQDPIDNMSWWKRVIKQLDGDKDQIILTVCGSTQEIHEKYRVGSKLEHIFKLAKLIKEKKESLLKIKVIRFKYNEHDIDNIVSLWNNELGIHNIEVINTVPFREEFKGEWGFGKVDSDIGLPDKQRTVFESIKNRHLVGDGTGIRCRSYEDKFINIDNFGNVIPCFYFKIYCPGHPNFNIETEYDYIYDGMFEFCNQCRQQNRIILDKFGVEQAV